MKLNHEDSGLCLTEWKHALGFMTLNHDDSGLCLTGWKHALETCFVAFFFFLKKKRKKEIALLKPAFHVFRSWFCDLKPWYKGSLKSHERDLCFRKPSLVSRSRKHVRLN